MFFAAIFAPHPLQLISCRDARLIVTSVRFLTNSSGIGIGCSPPSEMGDLRVDALHGDLPRADQLEDLERLELSEQAPAERQVHGLRGDSRVFPQEAAEVDVDDLPGG